MSQATEQPNNPPRFYDFGPFRLDPVNRLLLRNREVVPLTSKVFDLLLVFVSNSGRMLDKEDLMKQVWPESFVEEGNLTRNVSTLRKVLGEAPQEHQYIVTVPGRGYRFVAKVREVHDESYTMVVDHSLSTIVIEHDEEALGTYAGETTTFVTRASTVASADSAAARTKEVGDAHAAATGDNSLQTAIGANIQSAPNSTSLLIPSSIPKRIAVVTSSVAVVLLVTISYFYPPGGNTKAINSIAVLPFINDSNDPNTEFLSDGISESLMNGLSQLPQLRVMSRNSVFHYKGRAIDAKTVGKDLGVQVLLAGRVVKYEDRLLINVELINTQDNSRLWGNQYDRQLTEILSMQNQISQDITEQLRLRVTGAEQRRISKQYTENSEAYQLYLHGRYHWNKRTGKGLQKAAEYFNQAIAKDAAYIPAYAGLADCYALYSTYEISSPHDSFPKAEEAALKALALDDKLAEAHTSLAFVRYHYNWDWALAEREFRRAIELKPNYVTAHHWYGEFLAAAGRFDEALAEYRIALQLDPLSLITNMDMGRAFYLARRYDEAIAQYHKALEFDPESAVAHYNFSETYERQGKYAEAASEYVTALYADGFNTQQIAPLKEAFAASGYEGFLRAKLAWWNVRAKRYNVQPIDVAQNHAALHERDQAFAWLQKAYDAHDADLVFIKTNPAFENLHDDPRFTELLRRMKPAVNLPVVTNKKREFLRPAIIAEIRVCLGCQSSNPN